MNLLPQRCRPFLQAAKGALPPDLRKRLRKAWIHAHVPPTRRLDLSLVSLIRDVHPETLADPRYLESDLLPSLGFNDEALEEFPDELYQYCGHGLFHWQYPNQFSKYLVLLSKLRPSSYLEIGVRHGGTFIISLEYLKRFNTVTHALAVDIKRPVSMKDYQRVEPRVTFLRIDSASQAFNDFIASHRFDLALIDGDHEEDNCRRDFLNIKDRVQIIALHDIDNAAHPGVMKVWNEIKRRFAAEYDFLEFRDQYASVLARCGRHFFGIGVAVPVPKSGSGI
jgi:hypothetical protein